MKEASPETGAMSRLHEIHAHGLVALNLKGNYFTSGGTMRLASSLLRNRWVLGKLKLFSS
jgi:hypothetical protein